ncbi:MAG: hypothetical protein V1722_05210 [Candidatus Micrarchaeota archaeon]
MGKIKIRQLKFGEPVELSDYFWQVLENLPKHRFKKIGRITQIT